MKHLPKPRLLAALGLLVAAVILGPRPAHAESARDELSHADSPDDAPDQELSLNLFRSPSIGLEYRYRFVSLHAGYYPTVINEEGRTSVEGTTSFARTGLSLWFLPVSLLGTRRSSFYVDLSFVRELGDAGWGSGALIETGFRLFIWRGAFVRLGVSALYLPEHERPDGSASKVKLRPNPRLGWAVAL